MSFLQAQKLTTAPSRFDESGQARKPTYRLGVVLKRSGSFNGNCFAGSVLSFVLLTLQMSRSLKGQPAGFGVTQSGAWRDSMQTTKYFLMPYDPWLGRSLRSQFWVFGVLRFFSPFVQDMPIFFIEIPLFDTERGRISACFFGRRAVACTISATISRVCDTRSSRSIFKRGNLTRVWRVVSVG